MEAAIVFTGADKGNLQLVDPVVGGLRIEAQQGFEPPFLEFFAHVAHHHCACGLALQRGAPIVVPKVAESPVFVGSPALDVLLTAGVDAVQSMPLIWEGRVLGVLSIHYGCGRTPTEGDQHMLFLIGHRAARLLAWSSPAARPWP